MLKKAPRRKLNIHCLVYVRLQNLPPAVVAFYFVLASNGGPIKTENSKLDRNQQFTMLDLNQQPVRQTLKTKARRPELTIEAQLFLIALTNCHVFFGKISTQALDNVRCKIRPVLLAIVA